MKRSFRMGGAKKLAARLLLVAVTYLAGVGISVAFDRSDPWISGLSTLGPLLGGVLTGALIRRSEAKRSDC
ncbi:hypothetical protein ABJI51_06680 [Amycolatopsis sp. NEAU-NG30]|uniref:Holin n=1 Tax=Amycolatopsis melonis TaxID=3156488 RepID=A0ABV0L8X4_9PSEU